MVSGVKIFANDGVVRITASGGEAALAFDFALYDESYIKILRVRSGTETELVLNTDYTVPLASIADEDGGLINLSPVAQAGDEYTLLLNVPYSRESDFNQAGDFFADTLNRELDLLTQQNQQIVRDIGQALQYPSTFAVTSNALPEPVADSSLVFDGVTGAIKVGPTTTDIADAATNAATAVAAAAAAVAAVATVALNNYTATTNPSVNDDSGDGYSVGSRWVNVTADLIYECVDATLGAAVWKQVVDTNSTQTLTNKTISGASNTISNVSLTTGVTGTLPVANGGTGATSLTANNVLLGNGTSALQVVAPGASGNLLTSNGTTWVSSAPASETPTSWTPDLSFTVPGNLSVTYSVQSGTYIKRGRLVTAWFMISTSAFTHTTATGVLRITGLPFAISNSHEMHMPLGAFAGITKANYTQFECRMTNGDSFLEIIASGSGQTLATVSDTDVPSGTNKFLYGCVMYTAAS